MAESQGGTGSTEKWTSHGIATFVLECVGLIAIIGALVASVIQVARTNDALELSNEQLELTNDQLFEAKYESVYGHQLDLWKMMVEQPQIAPYIVGGQMPPEDDPAVEAALVNALDFYAYLFEQLAPRDVDGNLPQRVLLVQHNDPTPTGIDPDTWSAWWTWAPTILDGFDNAPGMCALLLYEVPDSGLTYDQDFVKAVQDAGRCP